MSFYRLHVDEFSPGLIVVEVEAPELVIVQLGTEFGGEQTAKGIRMTFNYALKMDYYEILKDIRRMVRYAFDRSNTVYTGLRPLPIDLKQIQLVQLHAEYPVEHPHYDNRLTVYVYDQEGKKYLLDMFERDEWDEMQVNLDVFRHQGFETKLGYETNDQGRTFPVMKLERES